MHLNQTARTYPTLLLFGGTLLVQSLAIAGAYSAHWLLKGSSNTTTIASRLDREANDNVVVREPRAAVPKKPAVIQEEPAAALPELGIIPESALESPLTPPEPEAPSVVQENIVPEQPARLAEVQPEVVPSPPIRQQTRHTIRPGDNLTTIWAAHGAPRAGALAAGRAFASAGVPTSGLRLGEQLLLDFSADGSDIVRLERKLRDGRLFILEGSASSGYSARFETPPSREAKRVVTGQIDSSFSKAALGVGVPYPVIDELVDIFGSKVAFDKNLQPGDGFTIHYRERELLNEPGSIITSGIAQPIDMAAIEANGQLFVAIRHVNKDGVIHYFDQNGRLIGDTFLRYPVSYTRISSTFSGARFHPVLGRTRPHNGVDFAAPLGTPVRSVGDGVVVEAGWQRGAGNMVRIRHGEKYMTEYFHLSKISRTLRPGSRVARGEVIGAVGMTGLATGPHLHFGFFERGVFVNPLSVTLPTTGENEAVLPQPILRAALETLGSGQQDTRMAGLLEQYVKASA